MSEFQDWKTVSWNKTGEKRKEESKTEYIARQTRQNNISSSLRTGSANQNKTNVITNAKKIDKEEDTFKLTKISSSVSKKISQVRCEKKWTQKEFAQFLYLPVKVVQEYENGKAVYNAEILNRMEKVLGVRVRD